MAQAKLVKELIVKTQNEVGMMEQVASAISDAGVNITALHAFSVDKEAIFRITTADSTKAREALEGKGFEVSERDVVSCKLEDKVGSAADMAKKIKDAGIDIVYIYGSTSGEGTGSNILFHSSDDNKAVAAISGQGKG